VELSKTLPKDYQIVLVGTSDSVDKLLPSNIISIHRTENQIELAKIYSASDVFINPTREDNFPTVNIEAIACGTPVITFNTGGSPEIIDETCGIVVEKNDVDGMLNAIINVCENKPFKKEDCVNRAKNYDMNDKFKEYVKLYEDITHSAK
jgi:glycosyltransferase involved in cell wall biosynthesis